MSEEQESEYTGKNRLRKLLDETHVEGDGEESFERTQYCADCDLSAKPILFSAIDYQRATFGMDEFDPDELSDRVDGDVAVIGSNVLSRYPVSFEREFFMDLFFGMSGHLIEFNPQGEDSQDWYFRAVRASNDLVQSPPVTFREEYERIQSFMLRALKASPDEYRTQWSWLNRHLDIFLWGGASLVGDEYARDAMSDIIKGRISVVAAKGLRRTAAKLGLKLPKVAGTFLGEAVLSIADLPTYNFTETLFELSQLYDPADSSIEYAWRQINAVQDLRRVVMVPDAYFGGACDVFRESLEKIVYLSKDQVNSIGSTLREQRQVGRAYLGIEPSKGPNYYPLDLAAVHPRYIPDELKE